MNKENFKRVFDCFYCVDRYVHSEDECRRFQTLYEICTLYFLLHWRYRSRFNDELDFLVNNGKAPNWKERANMLYCSLKVECDKRKIVYEYDYFARRHSAFYLDAANLLHFQLSDDEAGEIIYELYHNEDDIDECDTDDDALLKFMFEVGYDRCMNYILCGKTAKDYE